MKSYGLLPQFPGTERTKSPFERPCVCPIASYTQWLFRMSDLKNRQVNSGSFTPHTVSPMQHLQAVIVRNSKPLGFCFGEQESEPHPRN